jgi:hypothetical protein
MTHVDIFHNTHVFSSSHSDITQTCVEDRDIGSFRIHSPIQKV